MNYFRAEDFIIIHDEPFQLTPELAAELANKKLEGLEVTVFMDTDEKYRLVPCSETTNKKQ